MSHGGNYPMMHEPQCCGCLPLECGVRTLFFLTFLTFVAIVIEIIVGAVEEQWYVFTGILLLIPIGYTIFWILAWTQNDSFGTRYRICQGFLYSLITSIIVNIVALFIVLVAFDTFWENSDADAEYDK